MNFNTYALEKIGYILMFRARIHISLIFTPNPTLSPTLTLYVHETRGYNQNWLYPRVSRKNTYLFDLHPKSNPFSNPNPICARNMRI
jgi:hypothetical protein